MLFFGHIGITLGVFIIILFIINRKVDYRFVLLGSMLPDIIDKPLSLSVFSSMAGSGRDLGHTLLLVLILVGISLFLYKNKALSGVKFLGIAAFFHLLEDNMWQDPRIFFWPLLGADPQFTVSHALANESVTSRVMAYSNTILQVNAVTMYIYETELIGLFILALFAWYYRLYEVDRLKAFILKGTVYPYNKIAPEMTVKIIK